MTSVRSFVSLALRLSLGSALFAPAALLAQDTPPAESGGLEEVTITARFREESLQQTPLAITAISGEALELRKWLANGMETPLPQFIDGAGNSLACDARIVAQRAAIDLCPATIRCFRIHFFAAKIPTGLGIVICGARR